MSQQEANNSQQSIGLERVLIFEGVQIFPFDVETLDPGDLLNNAILDFYMKYLYHVVLAEAGRPKVEICTSYFYQNVVCEDQENSDSTSEDIRILDKDFILLPINAKEHWFLVIICYPRNIGDHHTINVKELSRIIVLDSSVGFLKAQHPQIRKKLHKYLQKKISQESGKFVSLKELWEDLPTDFVPCAQQSNDYDCGLFLLEFAEKFILDNFPSSKNHFSQLSDDGVIDCCKKRQNIKTLIEHYSAMARYGS